MGQPVIFKADSIRPVFEQAREKQVAISLHRGHGVYVIPEVEQDLMAIAYAEGFDPYQRPFDDWYDRLVKTCDGIEQDMHFLLEDDALAVIEKALELDQPFAVILTPKIAVGVFCG